MRAWLIFTCLISSAVAADAPAGYFRDVRPILPQVNVYNADTGAPLASCKGHQAGIYAVAFNPAGDRLATGGFDGHVRIYNSATGELVKDFVPVPLTVTVSSR